MLNLEAADEHLAVSEVARAIGLDLLSPAARAAEATRRVPGPIWKTLLETGLVAPVPEERGGSGLPDTLTHLLAIENFAYGDPGIALASAWSGAAAFLLGRHGSPAQDELLARLIGDAEARGSVALYEGFGRCPAEYRTEVTVTGDQVRVSGHKVAVPFVGQAPEIIVIGMDSAVGGLRAVVVPAATPGVQLDRSSGHLALDATGIGAVSFDVTVPVSQLVGGPGADPHALAGSVERIRLIVAAAQTGVAQRAVDYAAAYATERVAFGRPIAGFQGVSFPLAEAHTRIAELRLELGSAASRLDGEPSGSTAEVSAAVTRLLGYAAEVATEATRSALQTLGGHGFITDHPVELWYRAAAALAALDVDPAQSAFHAAL